MDKFVTKRKRVVDNEATSQTEIQSSPTPNVGPTIPSSNEANSSPFVGSNRSQVNLDELEFDPGLRKSIHEFHPSQVQEVRRAYLQRGPCQPKSQVFPQTQTNKLNRRFNSNWFDEFGRWLEYSIAKDAAYCLCCYLFKSSTGKGGADKFGSEGFRNWRKKEKLHEHIGLPNIVLALIACGLIDVFTSTFSSVIVHGISMEDDACQNVRQKCLEGCMKGSGIFCFCCKAEISSHIYIKWSFSP